MVSHQFSKLKLRHAGKTTTGDKGDIPVAEPSMDAPLSALGFSLSNEALEQEAEEKGENTREDRDTVSTGSTKGDEEEQVLRNPVEDEVQEDSQTPPHWKTMSAPPFYNRDLKRERESGAEGLENSTPKDVPQPTTPPIEELREAEQEEEKPEVQSDEEELKKRQAFKETGG